MARPDLHRESGGPILGMAGTSSSPDSRRLPKRTPGPLGMNDHFAPGMWVAARDEDYEERQRRWAGYWERFGKIVHDYLGIPYKLKGRAVASVTGEPTGVATEEKGLVCTSFVDVVLSRYLYEDPERQLDSYDFGEDTDLFAQHGLEQLATNIEPDELAGLALRRDQVYGLVFHMKNPWTKKVKKKIEGKEVEVATPRSAGSRIHVGFVAFHEDQLFLIHASGKRGVHIMPWPVFLKQNGNDLTKFGGAEVTGPKFLTIYRMVPTP